MANSQKQEIISKLKKVYATISQGVLRAKIEYGPTDEWIYFICNDEENWWDCYTNNFIKQYYQIQKEGYDIYNEEAKLLNGQVDSNFLNNSVVFSGYLADGTYIRWCGDCNYYNNRYAYPEIIVDVNGEKKPNKVGKDIFYMTIRENGVTPTCDTLDGYTPEMAENDCKAGGTGRCCLRKLINDNWEIKEDYPW